MGSLRRWSMGSPSVARHLPGRRMNRRPVNRTRTADAESTAQPALTTHEPASLGVKPTRIVPEAASTEMNAARRTLLLKKNAWTASVYLYAQKIVAVTCAAPTVRYAAAARAADTRTCAAETHAALPLIVAAVTSAATDPARRRIVQSRTMHATPRPIAAIGRKGRRCVSPGCACRYATSTATAPPVAAEHSRRR